MEKMTNLEKIRQIDKILFLEIKFCSPFDGKPCQFLSVGKAQTNLFHCFILNSFLTCSSFLRGFSLTVFIKFFLYKN